MSDPTPTARRTVLAAGAAVALAGGTLTACGGEEKKPKSGSGSASNPQAAQSPEAAATPSASSSSGTGTGTGKALLKSSAVPVGGGTVLKDEKLVVTQPTAGSFRCFTAVCTHQGCIVNKVENGTIDCPCHGSKYQIADGAVAHGPATRPLAEKKITVAPDGDISLA